ncbi:MAG: hypothetical protein ACRELB_17765, partial [Polyangiaceae bacterium]
MQAIRRIAPAMILAGVSWLACEKAPGRAAAQPTATVRPSGVEVMGQMERQAPSVSSPPDEAADEITAPGDPPTDVESPARDAVVGARPDGTPVPASAIPLLSERMPVRLDGVELPAGASLLRSDTVMRIQPFPEEPRGTWGDDRAADE